jgi:septal ring-binding cell division protein DamX
LHIFFLLVLALQAGDWQCSQEGKLWDCRPPPPAPPPISAPQAAEPAQQTLEPGEAIMEPGDSSPAEAVTPPEAERQPPRELTPVVPPEADPIPAPVAHPESEPAPAEAASLALTDAISGSVAPKRPETGMGRVETPGMDRESPTGFVVQVGAFRNKERAQRAVRELDDAGVVVMPTVTDGEVWYVLLLGGFPGWEEAAAAGAAYQAAHPEGSFWVRNAGDLRRILRSETAE